MGFDKRSAAKEYEPQDDDTLEAIAERETQAGNPITASDIARFNWGTDDPVMVDELLRDQLGAYKKGPDKVWQITADLKPDPPLLIPQPFKREGLDPGQLYTVRVRKKSAPAPQFEVCICADDLHFDFDKSFVRTTDVTKLKELEEVLNDHPGS